MYRSKKILILVWACIAFTALFVLKPFNIASGQRNAAAENASEPDLAGFNEAVLKRFLTQPSFGMARLVMQPTRAEPLRSTHIPSFRSVNEEEAKFVNQFTSAGWEVGMYLYGRRATPHKKAKTTPPDRFEIRYRLNRPVPITDGLEEGDLPGSKKLMDQIKAAFTDFQAAPAGEDSVYRFTRGDWNLVARPVRAVNQSCVSCHGDYVVTEKLADKRFRFRKRAVGDVNGVIVYAYRRAG